MVGQSKSALLPWTLLFSGHEKLRAVQVLTCCPQRSPVCNCLQNLMLSKRAAGGETEDESANAWLQVGSNSVITRGLFACLKGWPSIANKSSVQSTCL